MTIASDNYYFVLLFIIIITAALLIRDQQQLGVCSLMIPVVFVGIHVGLVVMVVGSLPIFHK